ncbi:MAG TPA: 16S rRNA pseudouridylate synthase [Candidatus Levilactobacillus faecigallinarum]|uniref:16S rRNA pseudouridylate synthase n=1 Tax=Candidatus Levilactobacillus faecigallinarum TaxID=2838638 RepID=A0A9D1U3N0_9LACO|nr:16S rRNA pseudouridylate synthase [Candidatus Levilactobacillus faecigallinarum]
MNIERYLSEQHQGTPRQIFRLLRQGRVTVNDTVIGVAYTQVTPTDRVCVDGLAVTGRQPQYLVVNKPMGVVNDLNPTVAHSLGDLLNALDQQRQLGVLADLPKDTTGVVVLSDDHHFLDDLRALAWSSTLTVQLTGTVVPAIDGQVPWDRLTPTVDQKRKRVTLTVVTTQVAAATTTLRQLPNVTGPVNRVALGPLKLPVDLPIGTYRGLHPQEIDDLVAPLDRDKGVSKGD